MGPSPPGRASKPKPKPQAQAEIRDAQALGAEGTSQRSHGDRKYLPNGLVLKNGW